MAFPAHIVAAGGFTEDGKGNILLVKTHHNGWVFPGGQVENGESITDAVIRETKEESGIDVEVGPLVSVFSNTCEYIWRDGKTHVPTKVMLNFICSYKGGDLEASDETSDGMWVPVKKALEYITHPSLRFQYKAYLDFDGRILYAEYKTRPSFVVVTQRHV